MIPRLFLPSLARVATLLFFLPAASFAQRDATTPPPGGVPLISTANVQGQGKSELYTLKTTGPASSPTWEIATLRDTNPAWAIQLIARTTAPVKKGDIALLRFRARVSHTHHETGQGQIRAVVQRAGGDYQRSAMARFDLLPQWQDYHVPVRFASDYGAGEAGVYLGFGFHAQTVQITDLALLHYGTKIAYEDLPRTRVTYQGQSPDAAWRREAEARIERLRKGDIAIEVVDSAGRPLPAARVSVEMTRHHFEFGTAAPFSLLMSEGENGPRFRETLFSIFNAVGPENDLKWPFWAGDRDTHGQHRERTLAALRWLKEREIPVRGHVLVWASSKRLPKEIVSLIGTPRQKEIPERVLAHIRDIASATAGLVSEWDVLNEPYNNHELMDLFGKDIMVDWFKTAREVLGPDVPLYFNDWGNHDLALDPVHLKHFIDTARFIQSRGGPIDGLGLQCHIGGIPPAPESLLATLDHYQKELGLPVKATEFDFMTDDPQLHADYSRDFLIAYFSHPIVAGVQFWGFWEGAHWRPAAALYDRDWTERPAGTAVRTLIRDTWWTRAAGDTGADGRYSARGFYGRYQVRATLGDRTVEAELRHVPGATGPTTLRLVLP